MPSSNDFVKLAKVLIDHDILYRAGPRLPFFHRILKIKLTWDFNLTNGKRKGICPRMPVKQILKRCGDLGPVI